MVCRHRSRVSTVFFPRHNNSAARRCSRFPAPVRIARSKKRLVCRRAAADRCSHRAIEISFVDSCPRSDHRKRCRWDIDKGTPVVRRWILQDISKEFDRKHIHSNPRIKRQFIKEKRPMTGVTMRYVKG